jgi:hypothetical protein
VNIPRFDRQRENNIIGIGRKGPKNYKPQYQLKKMNWEFHAYDDDFSPSVPHGHSGKYKLNVITGAIIDTVTGIIVAYLDKKDNKRLLSDRKFQKLAVQAREYYLNKNPGKVLPDIGFITDRLKRINRRLKVNGLEINVNRYSRIFGLKNNEVTKKLDIQMKKDLKYVFKTTVKFKRK